MELGLTDEQKEIIVKAAEEFNLWKGHATIMFNTDNYDCWCDIFCSDEDWKDYHNAAICKVLTKDKMYGFNDVVKIESLMTIIEKGYYIGYSNQVMSDEAKNAYYEALQ